MERAEGGMTALQYAAREGNVETGKVLIDASADVNAPEPQHNFTPMLIAIYNGKYDFASLLLGHGAKVNDGSLYLAIELRNMACWKARIMEIERIQRPFACRSHSFPRFVFAGRSRLTFCGR